MIKLGISSCLFHPDMERTTFGPKTLNYIENDMAAYLTRKNVLPILIPHLKNHQLRHLLENLDALVLQGGSDLSPESYGEAFLDEKKWPGDKIRDQYELKLINYFYTAGKPIFGICRGAQILNVYFGGTLWQDLKTERSDQVVHRDAKEYDHIHHKIQFEKKSFLARLYKDEQDPHVNSVHHQGIKKLGKDLIIEAICPEDDTIEAFSHKSLQEQFILGVQWHPEFSPTLGDKVINPNTLIDYFLKKVKNENH